MIRYDIQAIIEATDILALAGEYTELKRVGRQWRGCCPFHQEKTPSFYVDPAKRSWYCHGACHAGGNAIALLQRAGMSFRDAARTLAERAGLRGAGHWVSPNERRQRSDLRAEADCFWFNRAAAAVLAVQPLIRWHADSDDAEACISVAYRLCRAVQRAPIWDRLTVYEAQPEEVKQANRATMRQQGPPPAWEDAVLYLQALEALPGAYRS